MRIALLLPLLLFGQTTASGSGYEAPLLKALTFVLAAQYPNGAWPQRYPPRVKIRFGGRADCTSRYTFHDEVTANAIDVLLEAHRTLGNEACRQAARRGMDFYLASLCPSHPCDPRADCGGPIRWVF